MDHYRREAHITREMNVVVRCTERLPYRTSIVGPLPRSRHETHIMRENHLCCMVQNEHRPTIISLPPKSPPPDCTLNAKPAVCHRKGGAPTLSQAPWLRQALYISHQQKTHILKKMKLRPDMKPSSTVHLYLVQYIITKNNKNG